MCVDSNDGNYNNSNSNSNNKSPNSSGNNGRQSMEERAPLVSGRLLEFEASIPGWPVSRFRSGLPIVLSFHLFLN